MAASQFKSLLFFAVFLCSARSNAYTNSHDYRRSFGVKKSAPKHAGSSTSPDVNKNSSDNLRKAGLSQAAVNTDAGLAVPSRRQRSSQMHGAAHGILSPEIVTRMDDNAVNGRSNPAVDNFLLTYKRKGPMSCLEMLSDPDVLPHLTQAMRDII